MNKLDQPFGQFADDFNEHSLASTTTQQHSQSEFTSLTASATMNKDVAEIAGKKSRLPTNLPEETEVIRKVIKRRPARKQVEEDEVEKKAPEQSGQTYNVWYHKWAGGDKYDSYNAKTKSQTRCNIERDMGYTRADTNNNPYCCLFFARGCCPKG